MQRPRGLPTLTHMSTAGGGEGGSNPPLPEPTRHGFPAWARAAVVLAVAVGIAAVIFVLATRDPQERAGDATTPSPTEAPSQTSPTETPTEGSPTTSAAFEELAALLPSGITDCQPVEPGGYYEDATSVAYCSGAGRTDVGAYFYMFDTEPETAGVYDTIVQGQGYVPDTGSCSSGEGGELSWDGGGGSGRIMCGSAEDVTTLLWTSDGFPIIGQLIPVSTQMELAELYEVWQDIPNYGA